MQRYFARWTAAEGVLFAAWAAMAVGLLATGFARGHVGIVLLGAFAAWQMCDVWVGVYRAR
jgi:hypothetical protein